MTTATQEQPKTQPKPTEDTIREVAKSDAELALEAAIAETQKLKIQHEREQRDAKQLAEVKFGPGGLECDNLASLWRVGQMLARSDMVPEQYRGKPENCLIALQMAQRCRVDVFMFMQNTYIVHGRPGIEAKLAIAMLNMSGKIEGRMKFEMTGRGPAQECTASVFDKESGEQISMKVDWKMVEAEGWNKKSGSKWNTMPEIMFPYRSAMFLIRTHYPEVLLGMQTVDELDDVLGLPGEQPPPAGNGSASGSAQDQIYERLLDGDDKPEASDEPPPESKPESRPESKPPENQPAETDTKSETPQPDAAMDEPPSGQPSEQPSDLPSEFQFETETGDRFAAELAECESTQKLTAIRQKWMVERQHATDPDGAEIDRRIAEVQERVKGGK